MISRRTFLGGIGAGIALAAIGGIGVEQPGQASPAPGVGGADIQVPYSAGRKKPAIKVPLNACDSHHHIYDPVRYPYLPTDVRNQPPATVDAYRLLQKRLGLTRNVVVTPSAYGTDNRCTLDAVKQMGDNARAVVVVDETVTRAELKKMHNRGARGIRFNIATGGIKNAGKILTLAKLVHEFGWHVQFYVGADDLLAMESTVKELPTPIVFDHLGHLPQPAGADHPAFRLICSLLDKGKTWVKLSGLYQDSKVGGPSYDDSVAVGQAYVQYAPQRLVWGTDWPHPSIFSGRKPWPDDALLLDKLAEMAPDEKWRNRILVDNPAILYGFTE